MQAKRKTSRCRIPLDRLLNNQQSSCSLYWSKIRNNIKVFYAIKYFKFNPFVFIVIKEYGEANICANPTKWSNTLKQSVGRLPTMPTNCLSVFDHFVSLALKGLKHNHVFSLYHYRITLKLKGTLYNANLFHSMLL